MLDSIYDETKHKMDVTIAHLTKEFAGVRTGRASIGILDGITVDYYGTKTPLSQVANLSTPDPLTINVGPWEVTMVPIIEKAIMASDLGLNPSNDGKTIRISIPPLTEERRKELTKHVRRLAEEAKVALRNVRRESVDKVKKQEKNKEISEDEAHTGADKIQKIIDEHITLVDKTLASKEKEVMDT